MDHAELATIVVLELVCVLQSRQDVGQDVQLPAERKWRLALLRSAPDPRERLALEVLHRHEEASVDLADLVGVDDVGMVQPSSEPRLVDEHPDELGIVG